MIVRPVACSKCFFCSQKADRRMLRRKESAICEAKTYRVKDARGKYEGGVTAATFLELIQNGKAKLHIPKKEDVRVVRQSDGTHIDGDEIFQTLPRLTVLIFLRKAEKWIGVADDDFSTLFAWSSLKKSHKQEKVDQLRDRIKKEKDPERINIMSHCLNHLESNTDAEKREDHEDWFQGVDEKFKTKSEVMSNCAKQRIRSYFISAKDQMDKQKVSNTKAVLQEVLEELAKELTKNQNHGHYFDRTAEEHLRMCDSKGWFTCEGPFNEESCSKFHNINPYSSRHHRNLFQLWNLDHIIEKSRSVIPAVIEAAKLKTRSRQLNHNEVYNLLFTRTNLKLVHIECHKKAARDSKLDTNRFIQ